MLVQTTLSLQKHIVNKRLLLLHMDSNTVLALLTKNISVQNLYFFFFSVLIINLLKQKLNATKLDFKIVDNH